MLDVMDLLSLTIPLITGTLLGYTLREKWHTNFDKITFGVIILLIFSLGFSIGSNNELLGSMPKVGLNALVILFFSMVFSIVFVKLAMKLVKVT